MLTDAQRQWLLEDAHQTLGLTEGRARILAAVLDRDEPFSLRGIGRLTGFSPENVRLALEKMVARGLIDLRTIGDPKRPKASFTVEIGRRLEGLLPSASGREAAPPEGGTIAFRVDEMGEWRLSGG
jgi:hypothetical protein